MALKNKFRRSRREDRGRDDDTRYPNEFIHSISGQVTELEHVESSLEGNLDLGCG